MIFKNYPQNKLPFTNIEILWVQKVLTKQYIKKLKWEINKYNDTYLVLCEFRFLKVISGNPHKSYI